MLPQAGKLYYWPIEDDGVERNIVVCVTRIQECARNDETWNVVYFYDVQDPSIEECHYIDEVELLELT